MGQNEETEGRSDDSGDLPFVATHIITIRDIRKGEVLTIPVMRVPAEGHGGDYYPTEEEWSQSAKTWPKWHALPFWRIPLGESDLHLPEAQGKEMISVVWHDSQVFAALYGSPKRAPARRASSCEIREL